MVVSALVIALSTASSPGSCLAWDGERACGGPAASGSCSCTASCAESGDCCTDVLAVCEGEASGFVQLVVNEEDVQPPVYIMTVGGRPSHAVESWRHEAAGAIYNMARYLANQVMSEPPAPFLLMGKQPGAAWYMSPTWEPTFLPRYIDVVLAWAGQHLDVDAIAALQDEIVAQVTWLDRKERGAILETVRQGLSFPSRVHPVAHELSDQELLELEHKAIYAFGRGGL